MKTKLTVTKKNINQFFPYQGNDKTLKLGDIVMICDANLPCVRVSKGNKKTFSIYYGEILNRYNNKDNLTAYTWMRNRYSINDKYTK